MPPRATDGDSRNRLLESRRSRAARKHSPGGKDSTAREVQKSVPRTQDKLPNVRPVTGDVAGLQARPKQGTDHAVIIRWTKVLSCTRDGWTLFEHYSEERKISTALPDTANGNTDSGDTKGTL